MGKNNRARRDKRESARERHKTRAEKKNQNSDGDDEELQKQLNLIGLALRETTADGNCLFRAISDQLVGSEINHKKIRNDTVTYMRENEEDFKPFIEDNYENFLQNLQTLGEFGGNEALVAMARRYNSDIVIHQKNQPIWTVSGPSSKHPARQLHLAYHDWEHYSSVRKMNDSTNDPAFIQISFDSETPKIDHAVKEDDIEIKFDENSEYSSEPEIIKNQKKQKPLSAKEKKRARKVKGTN